MDTTDSFGYNPHHAYALGCPEILELGKIMDTTGQSILFL